jgi:hypothetical protein
MKRVLLSVLTATAFVIAANAQAQPAEQTEISLTRTAQSGATVSGRLTKNVYRYVEREIVEIIQVPYTVTVPYEVVETYYVHEQVCGWHNRQVCTPGGSRQECRPVRTCRPGRPGQPPVCSISQVCRIIPGQPVCRVERDYRCHLVRVPRTRVVTRYRTETRYRPEERRRTVTDQIFERQWGVNVAVNLPTDADLQGDEHETVLVRLRGVEGAPEAEVRVDSPVYSYRVTGQTRSPDASQIDVQLELVAKYQPEDLGERTIQNLVMARTASGHQVQFEDAGVVARTTTSYRIQVADKDTGRWVFEGEAQASFGSRQVVVPVTAPIAADHDHVVRLTVNREGRVIAAPVSFQKETHQVGQLNPAPYVDPNGVREFVIEGQGQGARLVFTDATPNDGKVETVYAIKLQRRWLKFLWEVTTAEATLARRAIPHDSQGRVSIPLASFPGLSAKELAKFFEGGDKVIVEIAVTRTSPRLGGASPVRFAKEAKVRVAK